MIHISCDTVRGLLVMNLAQVTLTVAFQICYGMLYGIGAKALGEQIGVEENDATVFMESFKAKYTGE